MFPIRLAAASAALLMVLPPALAQTAPQPSAATMAIQRYLATVRTHRVRRVNSWMSPQATKTSELIYISSSSSLNVYTPNGKNVGVIAAPSGGNFGNGVAVDAQQNVYVGGAANGAWYIFEYAPGTTQPSRTLSLGSGGSDFSMGIAINKNGTVFAAQPYDYRISYFAAGATSPSGSLNIPPDNAPPFSLTIDRDGTLFAMLAGSSSFGTAIAEYPHGKGSGSIAPYETNAAGGFGIAADGSNHIVITSGGTQASMYVYLRNDPYWIQTGGPGNAGFLAFNRKSNRLYYGTVLDQGPAGVVAFPSLSARKDLQTTANSGIAVSPAVNF